MNVINLLVYSIPLMLLSACTEESIILPEPKYMTHLSPEEQVFPEEDWPKGGNVIILFIDDVGIDKIAAYDAHPSPAYTPNINNLAEQGVIFTKAYSNPTCSPSRASILTGRHAARTGIGRWISPTTESFDLQDYEQLIPKRLQESSYNYSSAIAGKWHLVSFLRDEPALHPITQGFTHHAGSLANPQMAFEAAEEDYPLNYWNWQKSNDGELSISNEYMTTDTTNEAIAFMQQISPPWFLYVPFNAPHKPLHVPPANLLREVPPDEAEDLILYNAMLEALDTEIGRLIESIPTEQKEQTTIFLIGDNGTPQFGIEEPGDVSRYKGSVFEGGVRIPFIVSGQMVQHPGTQVDALVHVTDVFPTILDFADVDRSSQFTEGEWQDRQVTIDGRTLLPWLQGEEPTWREYLYTEGFYPNGPPPYDYHKKMLRDENWKLIRNYSSEMAYEESFFSYEEDDSYEGDNLLLQETISDEALQAYERLLLTLERAENEINFIR
jgi:arylsulfatase A-like enzyme